MSDGVIIGVLSVAGTIVVQLIASASKNKENDARMARHEQQQQDALERVETELGEVKKRLDKHNGYAEKFAEYSKDMALIRKDVEYLKNKK